MSASSSKEAVCNKENSLMSSYMNALTREKFAHSMQNVKPSGVRKTMGF